MAKKPAQPASKKKSSGSAASRPRATAKPARKPKATPPKAAAKRPKPSKPAAPPKLRAASKRAPATKAPGPPARATGHKAALAPSVAIGALRESAPAAPLTPADVEEFRQILIQKRAEILGDVSTLQNETLNRNRRDAAGDLSSMPIHMADLGTDNYELEFTLGLIEGERAIVREIDEALERVRQGRYGLCLATGKPIGKARLRAKPWAKYCYEYTLAQETGQTRRV